MSEPASADELMRRAAGGDADAFVELAQRLSRRLFGFCRAHLLRPDEADDVRQECLLRAWRIRASYRGGDPGPWLLGIAMNVIRERRRRPQPGRLEADLGDASSPAADAAEAADQHEHLRRALAQLPPRQREAIACRFLAGLSTAQAARAMGVAEGTVKATLHQAVANLRRMLTPERT